MASRPLIKESLLLLNMCGIDPHKSNTWSNIRAGASFTLLSVVWFNVLLEAILNWKGLESMEVVTVSVGLYQLTFKLVLTLIKRKRYVEVMRKFDQFWSVGKSSTKLQNEIESTQKFIRSLVKFMTVMLILVVVTFIILPIFKRKLPYKTYYPFDLSQSPDYELALSLQLFLTPIGLMIICGTDGLFVFLIINIIYELRMLKEGFSKVPINHQVRNESTETLRHLYRMVDHHALISECIKDIRDIYSIYLLNVYFYSMALMGVSLLSMIATGFPPSLESFGQFGMLAVFYGFELFFYCATGSYLITESEYLSSVVYETNWWIKTQPELRRAYVLILMRANKAEALTAGGMFTLNLDSFKKVIRSTLSLFTLVEAIYKPQNFEEQHYF